MVCMFYVYVCVWYVGVLYGRCGVGGVSVCVLGIKIRPGNLVIVFFLMEK